ncbi:hypothetical protein TWF481_009551 [Arthrobotrys musiformis]|uniref:Uncharacterized protein n=1 Tax=Arthrobotrys musiformis TaxID=47236 RepID=A0AAV9W425_9PEZI
MPPKLQDEGTGLLLYGFETLPDLLNNVVIVKPEPLDGDAGGAGVPHAHACPSSWTRLPIRALVKELRVKRIVHFVFWGRLAGRYFLVEVFFQVVYLYLYMLSIKKEGRYAPRHDLSGAIEDVDSGSSCEQWGSYGLEEVGTEA